MSASQPVLLDEYHVEIYVSRKVRDNVKAMRHIRRRLKLGGVAQALEAAVRDVLMSRYGCGDIDVRASK